MADTDRTASLMTPSKLAQVGKQAAPVSPMAWLDRMAADAGHTHLRRLAELREVLETHARARSHAALAARLEQVGQAMPELDFTPLQSRGWWARTTGKARSAGATFAAQFAPINEAADALGAQIQALHKKQAGEVAATARTLMEIEVEYRALDKIVEQGARWLLDMKSKPQAVADDTAQAEQARADSARCTILETRLELLRAASGSARQSCHQAQATASAWAALLQMLQQALVSDIRAWHERLSGLAAASGDSARELDVDAPMAAHRELLLFLQQAAADCDDLRAEEKALAGCLTDLGRRLQAAS